MGLFYVSGSAFELNERKEEADGEMTKPVCYHLLYKRKTQQTIVKR